MNLIVLLFRQSEPTREQVPFDAPVSTSTRRGTRPPTPHVPLQQLRTAWTRWGSNPLCPKAADLQSAVVPLRLPVRTTAYFSERLKGLEPLTLALATPCSTTELQPHDHLSSIASPLSPRPESNRGPTDYESVALPTELLGRFLARRAGIEPATCGFGDRHSAN